MTRTEAETLAKARTLLELYAIIRAGAELSETTEEDALVLEVVDAEIRNRMGEDHPVGLASLLAPRD